MRFLLLLFFSLPLLSCGAKKNLLVVGDSIAAQTSNRFGAGGWGSYIGVYLPQYNVVNGAIGGKSSKSYWDIYWAGAFAVSKPDLVLLEFGHNDEKPEEFRHTDPDTTFKEYLGNYAKAVRGQNKQIVFVTPLSKNLHAGCKSNRDLEDYRDAMMAVGKELSVKVVDLWGYSVDLFEADCFGSKTLKFFAPKDNTHTSATGAAMIARFIASHI